ncbi:MAG: response regulator [Nitrospirales bacterium]|nr:response regulator [Nitrospirales bacterium]
MTPTPEPRPKPAQTPAGFHWASELTALLWDALPLGICLLSSDQTVVLANRTAARLFQRHPEECSGQSLAALTGHSLDLSETIASAGIWSLSQGSGDDTDRTPVEWQQLRLSGLTGITALLTLRDVSRQTELEQERNRLAAVAEESPYPIVELDRDGALLYANPSMIELLFRFGYDDEGKPDILPGNLRSLLAACVHSASALPPQQVVRGDACYSWTFCPVPGHHLVRAYAIDLSAVHGTHRALNETADRLRESNLQLHAALEQAQAATRAKATFLATITHELRTPMNGVIGMASLLLDTPLTDEQRSFVQTIQQCGETQLCLINDVLECSKIEAGKLELENLDFQLRTIVEDILLQFAERAESKGLELTGLVQAPVPNALRGDPARLRQVLTNFVGNAIKFTDRGEITLQACLETESPTTVTIKFEVTDSGIGISEDVQARLFQPFTQADSSTTRKYGGTGLGLSISKQLVELMGGTVGLRSRPDKGTTFWCTATFQKQPEAQPAILPSPELSGRRVLIVDDNPASLTVLHHLLSGWGMHDGQARNGEEALGMVSQAAAQGAPYDLAIVDLMMPELNGLQLAQALKARPEGQSMRLVILTSLTRPSHAEQVRRANCDAHLAKPVRHDPLQNCLRRVLGTMPSLEPGLNRTTAAPVSPSQAPTLATPPVSTTRPRVLVAEDNAVNQKLAVRMLERLGYQPDVVSNGQEALTALDRGGYTAVIMDCQMPVMDGYEATRRIRKREQEGGIPEASARVPIIALTANAMQGDAERCKAAGMDDYLTKPVKTQDLGRVLQRWIPSSSPEPHASTASPPSPSKLTTGIFEAEKMLENIGGDLDLFHQLIRLFLDRYRMMLQDIAAAIESNDSTTLERAAHSMKGTAGNLCAPTVVSVAGQLEGQARQGSLDQAPALFPKLEDAVQELIVVLQAQIPRT